MLLPRLAAIAETGWAYDRKDFEDFRRRMAHFRRTYDVAGYNYATYFFDGNGAMRTGWIDTEEGWYYSDTTSSTGWKYVNGAWYYLDGANEKYPGLMVADCEMDIGGAIYSFSVSGAMYTGWVQKPEGWYYYNGSGVKVTGWVLGAAWYYLDGEYKASGTYGNRL